MTHLCTNARLGGLEQQLKVCSKGSMFGTEILWVIIEPHSPSSLYDAGLSARMQVTHLLSDTSLAFNTRDLKLISIMAKQMIDPSGFKLPAQQCKQLC